jgi:hypothetical protein
VQAQVGAWKSYLAYHQATLVTETPNYVFGVYNGSLLSYRSEDGEIKTYSNINGLHDTDIRHIAYHSGANALVLVYANSNIDIFYGENNVFNLSAIKNHPSIQDKTVHNLEIIGDHAYLSTAFGLVVVNVRRNEIKDMCLLGFAVRSVCQNDDYLYAATSEGIKRVLITANLLDRENWKPIDHTDGSLNQAAKLLFFKDHLFYLTTWNHIIHLAPGGTFHWFGFTDVRSIDILNDQLVVLTNTDTYFYSDIINYTRIPFAAYSIDCRNSKNQYWLASGETGLTSIVKQPDTPNYTMIVSEIKVNSPKSNLNFYMTFEANKLLITGGGKGVNRFDTEGILMVYEDGKWYNFDARAIAEKTGLPCLDFVSVVVDPRNPARYFVGSWGEGLYEFQNNEFVNLYSLNNSSLQTAVAGSNRFIRVDGLVFDNNNNLFMVNADVQNGMSIFLDQKEWKSFYYSPLAISDPDRILISRNNQKWFNFFRGARAGIMVLDENGTVGDTSDDQFAYSGSFVDQQGNNIQATAYLAMTEDLNGYIWVGTDNGPIYFTSADQVSRGVCNRIISADEYNSGFRPLEGVRITAIAVDGGNRKWMGSAGSGLFIIDQSTGSETRIENFTAENSFLLSNTINSLAINNQTGEIFIGTDKGLCSYRSEAITGKENYSEVYAFPNPVRPEYNNQVVITGLMQNSTVKITDLNGNLIKEGISMGGQYIWNCTDRFGAIVKAGIYLVFAATPNGSQGVVTKIMVIK